MPAVTCTVTIRESGEPLQHFPLTVRSESLEAISGLVTEQATTSTAIRQMVTNITALFLRPLTQALTFIETAAGNPEPAAGQIILNPTGMLCWFPVTASVTVLTVASTPDGEMQEIVGGTTGL